VCTRVPECDSASDIYRRTHPGHDYDTDERMKCHICGATFAEADVVERENKHPGLKITDEHGLPNTLDEDAKRLIIAARGD